MPPADLRVTRAAQGRPLRLVSHFDNQGSPVTVVTGGLGVVDPNPIDAAIDQAMPLTAGGTGWRLRNAIRTRQRQQSLLDPGAFTHADLARVWGVSSGTVRQRIARARDRHRLVTVDR